VRENRESRAIVFGASGQGEAMAANRFVGVRAAVFYGAAGTQTDASGERLGLLESTRAHNDANVLSIGARFVTEDEAREAVRVWIGTPFSEGDRHIRRNQALDSLV
jgi:ribose 5-phosphate isomerase B